MQLPIDKAKAAVAITIVLLMASVMLIALPAKPVEAQLSATQQSINIPAGETPYFQTDTKAIISFRPNPIGLGQAILINVWISPALNTHRFFLSSITGCYEVTLTKPDGTTVVLKMRSTVSDTTSYVEYVVDQVGEWKVKFDFLGTYFPEGQWYNGYLVTNSSGNYILSAYYRPSSTEEYTFTVQEELVSSWPPSPLPTDYWTRPVHYIHREWWPILGNWPSDGYQGDYFGVLWDQMYPDTNPSWSQLYLFHPFVQGPESAHIVWKREIGGTMSGGIVGAYGTQEGEHTNPGVPTVVYNGRCYQTVTKCDGYERQYYLQCYDLRTGEVYWEIPRETYSRYVGYFNTWTECLGPQYVVYETPGASSRTGELTAGAAHDVELVSIQDGRLYKWHPYTGEMLLNVSIDPLTGTGGTFHNQLDGYVLAVQDLGSELPSDERYRLINWTTDGSTSNFQNRIISNTSYARSSLPSYIDWNAGIGVYTAMPTPPGIEAWYNIYIEVYNLYTGELIRNITSSHPDTPYTGWGTCVDHGKVAVIMQGGTVKAWDVYTGQVAWTFEMDFPWSATGFGVYGVASAYGMFFRAGYDGIYAIDWETGELVWKAPRYTRAPFESPYTDVIGGAEVNPGMTNVRIADGKIYIYDGEHSPDQPRDRAWSLYCFNATTGEQIWDLPIYGTTSFGHLPSTGPIVDGYLVFPSSLGVQFVIGKGQSATTVTAPDVAVPLGTAVLIKGTVLDQSPAQPSTPCVSKDSMRLQMEYLHFQFPIAGIWGNETITGVPVSLTAIGEDGTYYDLGTTVTNGYSGVFSLEWTPPAEGKYEIVASFAADESYGSSSSTTAVLVGPETEPYPTPVAPEQPVDNTSLLYGILAAVIVAIVLGIVAVLFTLKK